MPNQFEVKAKENSVSGGTPLVTGITVTKGELLTISASPDDKWRADTADRESNANGLSNPFGGNFGLLPTTGFLSSSAPSSEVSTAGRLFSPSARGWKCPFSFRKDA